MSVSKHTRYKHTNMCDLLCHRQCLKIQEGINDVYKNSITKSLTFCVLQVHVSLKRQWVRRCVRIVGRLLQKQRGIRHKKQENRLLKLSKGQISLEYSPNRSKNACNITKSPSFQNNDFSPSVLFCLVLNSVPLHPYYFAASSLSSHTSTRPGFSFPCKTDRKMGLSGCCGNRFGRWETFEWVEFSVSVACLESAVHFRRWFLLCHFERGIFLFVLFLTLLTWDHGQLFNYFFSFLADRFY